MLPADTIIDQWSPLSHKAPFTGRGGQVGPPSWVPAEDRRRLTAYLVLASYLSNVARRWLDTADQAGHREYGDPAMLVDRIVAGVLGDRVRLDVPAPDVPDEPRIPPRPDPLPADPTPLDQRIHTGLLARWETAADQALTAWEQAWLESRATAETRAELSRVLTQWWTDELMPLKLDEMEHDTCGLGDGVMTLTWSAGKRRPIVRVYDPGFYFPVLSDRDDGFPRKVHIAWEHGDGTARRLRRLTWELVECEPRAYPWHAPGDPLSTTTCVFSDGEWSLSQLVGVAVPDLSDTAAVWAIDEQGREARQLDLGIDYIPVVHAPNTTRTKLHFGESVLSSIAQLCDDIASSDTDTANAADLAAGPVLAASGTRVTGDMLRVYPGMVIDLGENGRMDVLDMAEHLGRLAERNMALLDRLSVNGRVPAEVMGRVDSSAAKSGVHLMLSFGPFTQLVEALRLTRAPKHGLLTKFATRMFQAGGVLPAGAMPEARIVLGSYLPSDLAAAVEHVTKLLAAKAISRATAVAYLVTAGFPVADAEGEVARIVADDTAGAKDAADATGSEQVAADRLGVTLPEPPAPPAVDLPVPPVLP